MPVPRLPRFRDVVPEPESMEARLHLPAEICTGWFLVTTDMGVQMARDWNEQFKTWARPPGKTEEDRCSNAVSVVRNAINASSKLKSRGVDILVQGSYQNNTNVRQDSDVDVGVVCTDTFFLNPLPDGLTKEKLGLVDATYHFPEFKNDVEEALVSYFGAGAVKRGDKAIDLHETTYHVEADVTPFFEYRHYVPTGRYLEGVELQSDKGVRLINWPEQHHSNGVEKNNATGTRYKSVVRSLKALSNEMVANGVVAGDIPGFFIECLVWNVPNNMFQSGELVEDVTNCVAVIYGHTKAPETDDNWFEVNDLKFLFGPEQKWTIEQANAFAIAAWGYADMGKQS